MDKSLLPIYSKPAIRWLVDNINYKFDDIVICCSRQFELLFKHEFRDTNIKTHAVDEPLGTLGHIIQCYKDQVIKYDDIVVIHYADCLIDVEYEELINNLRYGTTILVSNNVNSEVGIVDIDDNKVVNFIEKPKLNNYVWTGVIAMYGNDVMKYQINSPKPDFANDLLPILARNGVLYSIITNKQWLDIGNIRSYRLACKLAEEGKIFPKRISPYIR